MKGKRSKLSLQDKTFDAGGGQCGYVSVFIMYFFAGLGAVFVLFGCSETTRYMKIVAEDTIVGCFEFSDFFPTLVLRCDLACLLGQLLLLVLLQDQCRRVSAYHMFIWVLFLSSCLNFMVPKLHAGLASIVQVVFFQS